VNVSSQLRVHALADGAFLANVALSGIGTVSGLSARRRDTDVFFKFTSFLTPGDIYKSNPREPQRRRRCFAASRCRASTPTSSRCCKSLRRRAMARACRCSLLRRARCSATARRRTLVYGYGGFNISLPPAFSTARLVWIKQGGIYVQTNLARRRRVWPRLVLGGTKERKQNVFDDFAACIEHVIAQKYSSPEQDRDSGRLERRPAWSAP
jgi:prolyl oligopeptidase